MSLSAATLAARRARARAAPRPRPARRSTGGRPSRPVAPRAPRRVSGPGRPPAGRRARAAAPTRPAGLAAAVLRAARFISTLPDLSLVDRLVRGRGWIAVIAFLLLGIVTMQVSLLKLNAGIGRDVERSASLERRNGELRAQVSRLQSGERIQDRAGDLGMAMPSPGAVSYVRARRGVDAREAADALRAGRLVPGAAQAAPAAADAYGEPPSAPMEP